MSINLLRDQITRLDNGDWRLGCTRTQADSEVVETGAEYLPNETVREIYQGRVGQQPAGGLEAKHIQDNWDRLEAALRNAIETLVGRIQVDIILRGYPSRIRYPEWQKANSLPKDQLPTLSDEQRARVASLHVPEGAYAVGLKAAELAHDHAGDEMERVARMIAEELAKCDPQARLKCLLWDFVEGKFEFTVQHEVGSECIYGIPHDVVDDLLLERQGAESRFREAVRRELALVVD